MELFIAIATDPHVRYIIDGLSVFIVASRFIPALRWFGFVAGALKLILEFIQWYAKHQEKGRKMARETTIDERADKLLVKSDEIG